MVTGRRGPWREPAEETVGLYGPFVVHDGRQSGSITFGRTRLPIWAPYWPSPAGPEDLDDYTYPGDPTEEWLEAATTLVRRLLGLRGDFARLLLVLANAEEQAYARDEAASDRHFAEAHPGGSVCACGGLGFPDRWWEVDELRAPVVDMLRRCLAALGEDV